MSDGATLNGWKAIAAYLNREERTAMRWAAERGLPVRRAPGRGRGTVFAIRREVDDWLLSAREAAPASPPVAVEEPGAEEDAVAPVIVSEGGVRRRHLPALAATALAAIAILLWVAMPRPLVSRPPPDAAFSDDGARSAFLQASYDWNLRSPDALRRAIREYGAAIAQEPSVAASYVGLANAWLLIREHGAVPDAVAYPRAEAAARAALALSPGSAAAWRALAFVAFWWHGDRAGAAAGFRRALALEPGSALTYQWYSNALAANGQAREATRMAERGRELDPSSPALLADVALTAYAAGDRAGARRLLATLVSSRPDDIGAHRTLAAIALYEGDAARFLAEASIEARLRGDAAGLARLRALAATSAADRDRLLDAMIADAGRHVADPASGYFLLARLEALRGRGDLARAHLERACRDGESGAIGARGDLWLSRAIGPDEIGATCGGQRTI